jgi:hypothetical protein
MHVVECSYKFLDMVLRLALSQTVAFLVDDLFKQFSPTYVLHDYVQGCVVNVSFVILYNIGVIEFFQYFNLILDLFYHDVDAARL